MREARTAEQFFAELRGSMDLVVETCALLVAKHPEKNGVLGLVTSLARPIQDTDTEAEKHYKLGVLRALKSIADRVGELEARIESADIDPTHRH